VFSGTMRSNLDPYNEHSDMELWHVLKEANLMAMVAAIGGLDGRVDGSGSSSISLGQAQLVCLCRAALRKVGRSLYTAAGSLYINTLYKCFCTHTHTYTYIYIYILLLVFIVLYIYIYIYIVHQICTCVVFLAMKVLVLNISIE
jgi:hypothetical protein